MSPPSLKKITFLEVCPKKKAKPSITYHNLRLYLHSKNVQTQKYKQ